MSPASRRSIAPGGIGAGAGGVYVSDARSRVARFDSGGGFLGGWGSPGSSPGQFAQPAGVAADGSGNVYVADQGNDRIQRFDSAGAALGGWGSTGGGSGEFDDPVDVAAASNGTVFTLEAGPNNRIQKFSSIGSFMGTWGAAGTAPGQFFGEGIATDAAGNVYVADGNDRIEKFDPNGNLLTLWGSTGTADGQFDQPSDVAVDRFGNVFVVDRDNNRIQRFDANGAFLGSWGSAGDGPGEFLGPTSIAVDPAGDIYVADRLNNRVQKFARATGGGIKAPELTLDGRKRQKPAKLSVTVGCGDAPCTAELSGKVVTRVAGGKGANVAPAERKARLKRKLKPKTLTLDVGETEKTRLKPKRTKKSLKAIRAALSRGAKGKAVIRATANNAAGSDRATLKPKLKR